MLCPSVQESHAQSAAGAFGACASGCQKHGSQELQGWTLRPPAGSLLDLAASTVEQIVTARRDLGAGAPKSEKPRLCVALDYLAVMGMQPLQFVEGARYAAQRLGGLMERKVPSPSPST